MIFVAFFSLFLFFHVKSQTLSGFIGDGSVKRGSSVRGVVIMDIPPGLHVNANKPNNRYAIPTVLKVSSNGAILGQVSYPKGKSKKFNFNEEPINIYEGRVRFTFPIRVPSNFRGKSVTVRATVRYQACNSEVCFPPREKEILITAKVN